MNQVVTQQSGAVAPTESELIATLSKSLYPGAAPESIRMVLAYCRAAGLDPMMKPVHIVGMWDSKAKEMRDVVLPGVSLYRTQASRTGEFGGIGEPEFGPMVELDLREKGGGALKISVPEWCRVTVKRRLESGYVAEFTAREFWIENYATAGRDCTAPNAMWRKRPQGQLAKCAEAQALRKAFPELSSGPTADEMAGKAIDHDDIIDVGGAPAVPPEMLREARAAADKGRAAFAAYWKGLETGENRNLLAPELADLQTRTAAAQALIDAAAATEKAEGQPAAAEPAAADVAAEGALAGAMSAEEEPAAGETAAEPKPDVGGREPENAYEAVKGRAKR